MTPRPLIRSQEVFQILGRVFKNLLTNYNSAIFEITMQASYDSIDSKLSNCDPSTKKKIGRLIHLRSQNMMSKNVGSFHFQPGFAESKVLAIGTPIDSVTINSTTVKSKQKAEQRQSRSFRYTKQLHKVQCLVKSIGFFANEFSKEFCFLFFVIPCFENKTMHFGHICNAHEFS